MAERAIRGWVSGRVQGVFYRASLADEAQRLELKGYVRNLRDGRVEYLVIGEDEAVSALIEWSRRGPMLAKVKDVVTENYDGDESYPDFRISY